MHSDPSDSTLVSMPAADADSAIRFAGRTHPGRRDGRNEDSIGWNTARSIWIVADGMGGHANGDVASRIVRDVLASSDARTLGVAVLDAHRAIVAEAARIGAGNNMGSTVVATRLQERGADVIWVGDSRAYLWRKSRLQLITRDHSFLEALRDQGKLSEEQLRGHPNRHLVTQTLGLGTPKPSVLHLDLAPGDWLVLCSDGLNDELEDQQIASALEGKQNPDDAADALIAAALASGGRDNVSVLVVEPCVGGVGDDNAKASVWLPILIGVVVAIACATLWLAQ
jgi:PPM family protein phosphatase